MPFFDYECSQGHKTEHYLPRYTETVECGEDCKEVAFYRPSFWYSSKVEAHAQKFAPVVIHKDMNGNIRFPGQSNAPIPEGFKKVELSTIAQVRQFEKEINLKDTTKANQFRDVRAKFLDGQLAANRKAVDEIAAGGVWQGTDEQGRIIERHGISPRGMKILEKLREASMHKQAQGRSNTRPEFFVEAFSRDASNRDEHRDSSTDWNRVRK